MKRTQIKDALRNIWKQRVSFLSIIVIAFLGVTTFLGMNYSDGALRKNGSTMYNAVNYRDVEILSTAMFTPEDLDATLDIEGVADAEAVWQTGAKVSAGDTRQDVGVISLTDRVNRPQLIEGRLPDAANECAVEKRLADEMGWQLGDEVRAVNAKGETAASLTDGRFAIVGIANHPDHTSNSIPDTQYVMVTRDAFDLEALDNCFMKLEIVVDKAEGIDRFSRNYDETVSAVSDRLEELARRRAPIRDDDVRQEASNKLNEAQNKLDEAHAELTDARGKLDDGWQAMADGRTQIDENEAKLFDASFELETSRRQLEDVADQLAQAETQLAEGKAQLATGRAQLSKARAVLDEGRAQLIDGWDKLETGKQGVRALICGTLSAKGVHISQASTQSVDIDDPSATAMDFWITPGYKADLNRSLRQNVSGFIYSGEIPDNVLIAMYEALTEDD